MSNLKYEAKINGELPLECYIRLGVDVFCASWSKLGSQ